MIRYIANSKFSKVVSFLMAFLIFFNNIIFPTKAFALTGGPSQPEFTSFDPAGASEMVNLFTGDFSYNIPLMDVDGYPVNIAYHASPGMDEEASWTGLGWNVNAGAINRGMRGLPDDFNGDPVNRELNIEPYRAWGVSVGTFGELFGLDKLSAGGSMGIGVFHSNYTGYGIELSNNSTMGLSSGNKTQGTLTMGLGVKINSQDGMDIYPQLGVSGKLEGTNRTNSLGVNIGCAINSRSGLKSISGGYSISTSKTQGPTGRKKNHTPGENKDGKGIGLSFGSSSSIPMSSQGFMPKAVSNMSSQAYNLDFKLGGNACFYALGGSISGYYAENKMNPSQRNKDFAAYGYLFSQNATNTDMMDFNREKDGMMYPELPNMPIANYTFDMFSANAQGMNYAFRPHRNDIGILRDNATTDNSFGVGVGAEVMISSDVNVGVNVNIMYANGESGKWEEDNDFNAYAEFTKDQIGTDYEAAYFKVAGEKNADDAVFLADITNAGDEPYAVELEKKTKTVYKATDRFFTPSNTGNTISGSPALKKSKRAIRNELVSYLNATEASRFGLDQQILDYPELTPASFTTGFDNTILRTSTSGPEPIGEIVNAGITKIDRNASYCGNKPHHISEMSITQNNGSRYVYGIPMYNRKQVDAVFNIGFDPSSGVNYGDNTNMDIDVHGMVPYDPTEDDKANNQKGIDHYMEKNTMNDYSRGFLLTSVLSSDYVDRTGNGPSIDDYGDYTRFNYSRIGDEGAYAWRIPVDNKKAKFNQGLMADKMDNKGVYLYGEKDLWYTQSIETKNYIAFFVLNDPSEESRKDAYPVTNDEGGRSASNLSRYLKEIRLYAKKDFANGGIASTKPIKIVHFEYDYSLCPGVPNNINTLATGLAVDDGNGVNTNGKLTLKKIWFTYGNSQKGKSSPYTFSYADVDHDGSQDCNYSYNSASVDKWGMYKPNAVGVDNNMDFPYVSQSSTDINNYAAAWSLTQIKTPAGSTIKVSYEADDYAYIQNKEAGQLFKVVALHDAPARTVSNNNLLYANNVSRNFVIIDLKSEHAGIPITINTFAGAKDALSAKYLKGLDKMYFRFKVDMDNKGRYEFVPGYADIADYGVLTGDSTYQVNGTGQAYYRYAYIEMKQLGINDKDQATPMVSPITKAAFQMGRMYLPQVVFPGAQPGPGAGIGSAVKGLVTTIKDARYFLKGVNKALYERGIAKSCDLSACTVRLYNPDGFKKGGGSRVSKIIINDGWNAMSGEADSEYGQEYAYTTTHRNGYAISSGVTTYEPLLGGDENSMRYQVPFAIKKYFAPSDQYFQEEPLGESFFPDPLVGYSKLTVKNISRANVTAHATGRTEYEFYTAKDFPVVTDRTKLEKPRVKPGLLKSILKFGSTDKLYMSQGYVIKTNDMHGKLRSQKMFAEGSGAGDRAISGITYYYKTKTGSKGEELDNEVEVVDKTNTIAKKSIGKTTDFYTDSRSSVNDVYTGGIALNIQSATCTYYVPLVFVWPSFGHEHREFKSIGTTKLIQQYGLIDRAVAFENNSQVSTKNLLYDDVSGEVIMTQTVNDFDAPVYNLKYPAYWAYEDMGAAFANAGINFTPTVITPTGKVDGSVKPYFRPGDEVGIFDNVSNPKKFTKTWIVEDKVAGNDYYFVKADGTIFTPPPGFNTLFGTNFANRLKILRSGRRNLQSAPMASVLSLKNPVMTSGPTPMPVAEGASLVGGSIITTQATEVIASSAIEYSDKWQLLVGDKIQNTECVCGPNYDFTVERKAIEALINSLKANVPGYINGTSYAYWKNHTLSPGSEYLHPDLTNFLYSPIPGAGISPFRNCSLSTSGNAAILIYIAQRSIVNNGTSCDHQITFGFQDQCQVEQGYESGICGNHKISLKIKNLPCSLTTNIWNNPLALFNFREPPKPANCQPIDYFNFDASIEGANLSTIYPGIQCEASTCLTHFYDNCSLQALTSQCGMNINSVINPYVENIRGNWRVKDSWSYLENRTQEHQFTTTAMKGDIRKDGTYNNFKPYWKYATGWQPIYQYNSNNNDKWVNTATVNSINELGNVLEVKDALGRPSASLYGNHTLPVASANNSYYNQIAFDGFEDYDYTNKLCVYPGSGSQQSPSAEHFNFYRYKASLSKTQAHTGKYSIGVPANGSISVTRALKNPVLTGGMDDVPYTIKPKDDYGMFGPFHSYNAPQKFVLSVWAKQDVYSNPQSASVLLDYPGPGVSIIVNSVAQSVSAPKKSAIINGWQKLEYEFTLGVNLPISTIKVSLNNNSNYKLYYDDIRIHPFNSSMKSMVYDPYSLRLMAELDDRNFATLYEYDEEGTLVRVKKETERGIYTIKESRSGLKK